MLSSFLLGQNATARVLRDQGTDETISVAAADECAKRLLTAIRQRFQLVKLHAEYPIHYTNDSGQLISGWIDLLVETAEGFALIDHKASLRARSDWETIALSYSGQLGTYAEGVERATGRPAVSRWVHSGLTGDLVELC